MTTRITGRIAALLLAGTVLCASAHAQDSSAAEAIDWYMGEFQSSMEEFQETGSNAALSGMSSVIHRFGREPSLAAQDRVMAESQMRCVITHAIDQTHSDAAPDAMRVFHNAYSSVMALDVVRDHAIEDPVDLTYAWQAADCLWERYGRLQERADASGEPVRRVLHDRAARSMDTAVSMYVLSADSFARFNPDDLGAQIQARFGANIRQFQAASILRQHAGYSLVAQRRLESAHEYSEAILADLLSAAGQVNNDWLHVKQTQVSGFLMFGEQVRAAELARDMVEAISASTVTDQRDQAIALARGLPAEVGISDASAYLQTLDQLLAG